MPKDKYSIPAHLEDKMEKIEHWALQGKKSAIPHLLKLIKKNPKVPQIYYYLVTLYNVLEDYDKAEIYIERMLKNFLIIHMVSCFC